MVPEVRRTILLCMLLSFVLGSSLNVTHLNGTFELLTGSKQCATTIRIMQAHYSTNVVKINVNDIEMGNNTCVGDGSINMELVSHTNSINPTVRRGGGGGHGGGHGGGGKSGHSGGINEVWTCPPILNGHESSGFIPSSDSIPKRPTGEAVPIVKGSRLKDSGEGGKNWLLNGTRRSVTGEAEDDVSKLSAALKCEKVPHYYGFYSKHGSNTSDYLKLNFTCGVYGVEFRTRFIFYELPKKAENHGIPYLTTIGTMYKYEDYGTFELTSHPNVTCVYHNPEYSRNVGDCLPGDGLVSMKDGSIMRVDELEEGHQVALGGDVYMSTHKNVERIARFLRISVVGGENLEVTPGHYLYINGKLGEASSVRIGDLLHRADNSMVRVVNVEMVKKRGVYNPQTIQGDIVMNGFVISTYTKTIEPNIAHSALTPFRMIWRAFGWNWHFHGGVPKMLREVLFFYRDWKK